MAMAKVVKHVGSDDFIRAAYFLQKTARPRTLFSQFLFFSHIVPISGIRAGIIGVPRNRVH